ncbi:helix-turn-helix transcriptional regulator [Glaciihabitans sp. dw_435]|uniref:helix-turn-helix transcriptional regulator n=1 Tax=Glaciihabitans sp. dw_435 TaxID=2720081 RepID=UPI001BD43788|nr:helix-turn-helix transcriptional regulator [Glaciihabitans sp. dw_435]
MVTPSALLQIAGLSEIEEQIYLFVVHRGRTQVGDVVERCAIDAAEASAHLALLRDRGLISRGADEDAAYAPVDPRYALNAVTDRLAEQVSRIREQIPLLADQFDRTVSQEGGAPESWIVGDAATVASWYVRMQHQATHEIMMFDRPPYVSSPLETLEVGIMGVGVRWRGLYTAESFTRPGAWEETLRLSESGEESRIVPQLPVKLVIVDRSIALVSLSLDGVRADALVTQSPPMIDMLSDMYETYWARGLPLTANSRKDEMLSALTESGTDAEPVVTSGRAAARATTRAATPEEQAIIALIGAGLTDEAIAERLGIAVRSLRRRSQKLMAELGASNRFQAGVEAARRGWV